MYCNEEMVIPVYLVTGEGKVVPEPSWWDKTFYTKKTGRSVPGSLVAKMTSGYDLAYIAFDGKALHIVSRDNKAGAVQVSISGTTSEGVILNEVTTSVSITLLETTGQFLGPHIILGNNGVRLKDASTPADPGSPDIVLFEG